MKIKRDAGQLEEKLKEQIYLLQKSAIDFDKGDELEAIRIATHLRILLHDTDNSRSVLKLFNLKSEVKFINTSEQISNSLPVGFCAIRIGFEFDDYLNIIKKTSIYVPLLSSSYIFGRLDFDKWWNQNIVQDKDERKFTRQNLVLALANKEGGAHVDLKIDEDYYGLKYKNSVDIEFSINDVKCVLENDIVVASVRQIAYEVLFTLYEYKPNLFKEKYF